MTMLRKLNPEWALRLGLGAMYAYSGLSLFRQPLDLQGFLPMWLSELVGRVMPLSAYLAIQGAGELLMAAVFLTWFLPRWTLRAAAAMAALEMLGIVAFVGVDLITFRDLGLLGAALALLLLSLR